MHREENGRRAILKIGPVVFTTATEGIMIEFRLASLRSKGEGLTFRSSGKLRYRGERIIAAILTIQGIRWEHETVLLHDPDSDRFRGACPDFYIPFWQIFLEVKESAAKQAARRMQFGQAFGSRQEELALMAGYGLAHVETGSPEFAEAQPLDYFHGLVADAIEEALAQKAWAQQVFPDWQYRRRFRTYRRHHRLMAIRQRAG